MRAWIDSEPENMTDALALECVTVAQGGWNGWAVPVATPSQVADWLRRWAANDPNGTWDEVVPVDEWTTDADGNYIMDGWCFVTTRDDERI